MAIYRLDHRDDHGGSVIGQVLGVQPDAVITGPAGSTLYDVVKEGPPTHMANTCKRDGLYTKSDMFIEPSGAHHVHIGRNLGKTPVVLDVLYVDPAGRPIAESAPNPGCPGIK